MQADYNFIVQLTNPYFLTFLIGTALYSVLGNALDWLNMSKGNLKTRIADLQKLHPLMKKYFTFGKVSKAIEYNSDHTSLADFANSVKQGAIGLILLLGLAPFTIHFILTNFPSLGTSGCYIVFFILTSALGTLFEIPFGLYGNFTLEERYGFNTMTKSMYFSDTIKSFLINAVLGSMIIFIANTVLQQVGTITFREIGYVLAGIVLTGLLFEFLSINVFMKMFNTFTPLKNAKLNSKLKSLVSKYGYGVNQVFVMDGSRRSKHSNAFICGFGKKHKKIVIFDTMLKNYTEDEILMVLAHELSHGKCNHILKGRIMSILGMTAMMVATLLMMYNPSLYHAFGFNWIDSSNVVQFQFIGFVLSGMVLNSILWIKEPLESAFSRKCEYEADRLAVQTVGKRDAMVSGLIKLNSENLSDIFPHPAYETWNYSHPSLKNRILAIMKTSLKKNKTVRKTKKTTTPKSIKDKAVKS